jgi:hypothetical protein
MAEVGPVERIYFNGNCEITTLADGSVVVQTGTSGAPASEFVLGADGSILVNGAPLATGGGSSPSIPAGAQRVTLASNGDINILTGSDGDGALFTLTKAGKLLINGAELSAGGSAAEPAWVTPVLLNGWRQGQPGQEYPREPVRYRRVGNKIEFTGQLDGALANQAAGPNNLLFRLPAALAPLVQYQKPIAVCVNGTVMGQVKVFSNGSTIGVYYTNGVVAQGQTINLHMNGCYFYLDV